MGHMKTYKIPPLFIVKIYHNKNVKSIKNREKILYKKEKIYFLRENY